MFIIQNIAIMVPTVCIIFFECFILKSLHIKYNLKYIYNTKITHLYYTCTTYLHIIVLQTNMVAISNTILCNNNFINLPGCNNKYKLTKNLYSFIYVLSNKRLYWCIILYTWRTIDYCSFYYFYYILCDFIMIFIISLWKHSHQLHQTVLKSYV